MEHPSHDEYYKSDVARAKLSRIRVSPARTRSSVFIFNERTPPPNYRDYSTRFRAKYLMSTSYAQSTDYPIDFSAQLTIRHTWVIIGYEIGRRSIRWNRAEVRFLAVTPRPPAAGPFYDKMHEFLFESERSRICCRCCSCAGDGTWVLLLREFMCCGGGRDCRRRRCNAGLKLYLSLA